MSENFNALTPEQTEALAILAEECAEVIQAVSKVLRHGLECSHPEMGNWNNRDQLELEIGQALAAILVCTGVLESDDDKIDGHQNDKLFALKKWAHHIDWSKIDL